MRRRTTFEDVLERRRFGCFLRLLGRAEGALSNMNDGPIGFAAGLARHPETRREAGWRYGYDLNIHGDAFELMPYEAIHVRLLSRAIGG